MPLDFPASPTEGQVFSPPGGPDYIWHAPAWYVVVTPSTGIPEAPLDSFAYGRYNSVWERVLRLIGGTLTGNLTINKDSPAIVLQKTASNQHASVHAFSGALPRWLMRMANNAAESGSGAGSEFTLSACDDAGSELTPPVMQGYRSDRAVVFNDASTMTTYGLEGRAADYRVTFNTKFSAGQYRNHGSNAAAHLVIGASGLSIMTSPNASIGTPQVLFESARFRGDGVNMFFGATNLLQGTTNNQFWAGTHNFLNAAGDVTALVINTGLAQIQPSYDIRMQGTKTYFTSVGGRLIYSASPSEQLYVSAVSTYDPHITFDNDVSGVNFGYRHIDQHFYYGGFNLTPSQYKIYSSLDGPMLLSVRTVSVQGTPTSQVLVNDKWMTVLP